MFITAVFEVALDSCICTYACSLGLCEMGQTVLCSHGNSEMVQQCYKAVESYKGKKSKVQITTFQNCAGILAG